MTLDKIASVVAGQIMTRVTADKDAGDQVVESVKVLIPKAISSGVIVKEDLGDADQCPEGRIEQGVDDEKVSSKQGTDDNFEGEKAPESTE